MPSEAMPETEYASEKAITLIMEGDRGPVDRLFALYIPQLRRAASWMLQNPEDSEDAVQDGLLLAYRKLDQFQGRAKFSTWLHAIVVNAALVKLRQQKARPTTSIDQEAPGENAVHFENVLVDPRPSPEEEFSARERSRILARTLEDLPTISREVIGLMDIEGLPGKEAAQKLGITPSALKARHHRARLAIVRKMQEPREVLNAR